MKRGAQRERTGKGRREGEGLSEMGGNVGEDIDTLELIHLFSDLKSKRVRKEGRGGEGRLLDALGRSQWTSGRCRFRFAFVSGLRNAHVRTSLFFVVVQAWRGSWRRWIRLLVALADFELFHPVAQSKESRRFDELWH